MSGEKSQRFDGVVRLTVGNSGGNSPRRSSPRPSVQNGNVIICVDTLSEIYPDPRYVPLGDRPALTTAEEWKDYGKKQKKKRLKLYYRRQADILKSYAQDREYLGKLGGTVIGEDGVEIVTSSKATNEKVNKVRKSDNMLAKASIVLNLSLVVAKLVSAIMSGSLVVIGSLLDSALDVTTGFVLFVTNKAIKKSDFYHYPRGRSRLEPLALLIVSVIMGAVSIQMISKSVEEIAENRVELEIETSTLIIMGATVILKFIAMLVCYLYRSHQALVMALNHRNDCITNSFAIVCAYLADRYWVYLDPLTAILVGIFLLITWLRCGYRYVQLLSGKTAQPIFINRILKICVDHQPELKQVESIYAYYFGTKFLVEVVVTVDDGDDERWSSAKKIYDLSERLHRKLEYLDEVERAFVTVERRPTYRVIRQDV